MADFQVSSLLSEAGVETAYLVVPLGEALDGETDQPCRTVSPARKVIIREKGKEREVPYSPLLNLSFELETE